MHASKVNTAKTMPFSPHSILRVIARIIGLSATKISEKIGGSEYDNLHFGSGGSSHGVLVLRFFGTSGLRRNGRLHYLKFEVKLLPTKNR